jgi:hypothetical protein
MPAIPGLIPDPSALLQAIQALVHSIDELVQLLNPVALVENAIRASWQPVTETIRAFLLTTGDAAHPFTASPTVQAVEPVARTVANLGLVAVVALGSFRIMWSHSTSSIYSVRVLLPRLMLAVVLVNFAVPLFQAAVEVNNALCNTVLASGLPVKLDLVTFDPGFEYGSGPGLTLLTTAALFCGYLVLAFVYVIRYALLVVLAITAPLAGLLLVLPETHHYSRAWGSLFAPTLLMQPLQLLILQIGFHLESEAHWPVRHAFALAALYLCFKAPGALHASSMAGRHASSTVKRQAHHILRAALKA